MREGLGGKMARTRKHENTRVREHEGTRVRGHDSTMTQTHKCSSFPLKRNEGRYKESDVRRNLVVEYWKDGLMQV